ncbi:MAG: hypothetical protein V4537_08225 [Pseudomonadota bacterium]
MIAVIAALAVADLVMLVLPGVASGVRIAVHAALALAGFAVIGRRRPVGIGTAMLGLAGPAGLLVATLVARRGPLILTGSVDTPASPPEHASTGARMLDGRLHHASAGKLGSLVTVLRHGSVSARRRALETVVRSFEPALSPLIARALADRDQTIRALAAAAAARVSRNLAQGRAALALRADHGDVEAGDALVTMLADHARSNVLLSDAQRDALRRDVLALLRDRPASVADDRTLETTLAEAAWAAGDFALLDDLARRGTGDALAWWRSEARA